MTPEAIERVGRRASRSIGLLVAVLVEGLVVVAVARMPHRERV
jgi:hypothetical protein